MIILPLAELFDTLQSLNASRKKGIGLADIAPRRAIIGNVIGIAACITQDGRYSTNHFFVLQIAVEFEILIDVN